jgi:hypothetical protein
VKIQIDVLTTIQQSLWIRHASNLVTRTRTA